MQPNVVYNQITEIIPHIIYRHLSSLNVAEMKATFIDDVFESLCILLNDNFEKYQFDINAIKELMDCGIEEDEFHRILHSLNEKTPVQKTNGIYNTPNDVVDFIIANCISKKADTLYRNSSRMNEIAALYDFYVSTVFDPTVGSGEFLIRAFQVKVNNLRNFYNNLEKPTDATYLNILSSLHGNDIDISAIEICKVRLFFEMVKYISRKSYKRVVEILNNNLTNYDFVNLDVQGYGKKFDLILGNPPYVEDRKSTITPKTKYGNIYANVIQNSIDLLTDSGKLGFIIPISYISTQRMSKIRNYVEQNTSVQQVINFADRPSCLFLGVHQKLSILIAQRGDEEHIVYTSGYNYWYKDERSELFGKTEVIDNPFVNNVYYPKLNNATEVRLFKKIHTSENKGILALEQQGESNIFLNMRACFWIKAFSFAFESKEYKGFNFDVNRKWHILALLNSSMFWWYWVVVSDCWHITRKELGGFYVPQKVFQSTELAELSQLLEDELERTKVKINTKQANFEYKHRLCRHIIDRIDDCLASYYNLTEKEIEYIKNYAKKYRESLGA